MKKSELRHLVHEELNRLNERIQKGDAEYDDNAFANAWAFNLYNELNSNRSDSPMVIIMKWAERLEHTQKFTHEQTMDLRKKAMSFRGQYNMPQYKQRIKADILHLLKAKP